MLTHMARKYPLITQMYSLPPPSSAIIEGNAVDVMVASSAVSRPANPIATMIAQNLKPGLKGTTAAVGGLTGDASCMAGSGSEGDAPGSECDVDVLAVGDGDRDLCGKVVINACVRIWREKRTFGLNIYLLLAHEFCLWKRKNYFVDRKE